jgi:hypothetical protein
MKPKSRPVAKPKLDATEMELLMRKVQCCCGTLPPCASAVIPRSRAAQWLTYICDVPHNHAKPCQMQLHATHHRTNNEVLLMFTIAGTGGG